MQRDWCLYEKRSLDTDTRTGECHVELGGPAMGISLLDAWREAEPSGKRGPVTCPPWATSLQSWEGTHFLLFKPHGWLVVFCDSDPPGSRYTRHKARLVWQVSGKGLKSGTESPAESTLRCHLSPIASIYNPYVGETEATPWQTGCGHRAWSLLGKVLSLSSQRRDDRRADRHSS